jgi:hypothetical protein
MSTSRSTALLVLLAARGAAQLVGPGAMTGYTGGGAQQRGYGYVQVRATHSIL